ncbi:hypothetical protein MVEN_02621900 [Mycena venus]|uniref:Uncharacterized protein n=1 Tax=Mycena venus TaxID=2733690 RepID=A0A8H6WR01_9AGAR|nr:hypothetical protein MVEN_02621900 [Mycena venus]
MATSISIDIGGILREIRTTVTEIKNGIAATSEKKKAAQLLVYRALSLHPALDHMRPPTGMLADVDWYTELHSTFNSGIFRRLGAHSTVASSSKIHIIKFAYHEPGQNEHFKKMALLGETGTRARIMLLLLWIIGHRLSEDSVAKLLSAAFGDAIRRDENPDLEKELEKLVSVKEVFGSLRKMIKTKLPLPPDRNPFQGRDYNPQDEDKALPRSELWGYTLSEDLRYEYDTSTPTLFWNADPPPPNQEEEDRISVSSSSSRDSVAFEASENYATTPYEAMWLDDPTELWVHSRFCSVYPVHGWAHQSFVRVLLFNAFCGTQILPDFFQILVAVHVADRLFRRIPADIWHYAEQFIVARSLLLWKTADATQPWITQLPVLSSEERSSMVIFVDTLKWYETHPSLVVDFSPDLTELRDFMVNPIRRCPDAHDILSLPEISSWDTHSGINVLPNFDPETCVCGECELIQCQQSSNLVSFRSQYFVVTSRPSQCDALSRSWEAAISAAEAWLDGLVSRIECQFTLFPDVDRRMGPAVLEIANAMGIAIGSQISDQLLLRFSVALHILKDDIPVSIPKAPGPFGLGYVVSMPWTTDREDYRVDDGPDRVLFVNGGWLYDSISTDGVTLLHEREDFNIVYHTNMPGKFSAVCMPHFSGDTVSFFPPRLSPTTVIIPLTSAPILDTVDKENGLKLTLVLSRFQTDVFPLLSVCDQAGFAAPHGALAALIRVKCLGRVIETVWKPNVRQGVDLIQLVLPPSDASLIAEHTTVLEELAFQASDNATVRRHKLLREMLDELSRRVEPLTKSGSPVERTRACIVRCGARDGPVDAVVVLAASLRKSVYVLDRRECWECALTRMSENGRTIGISIDTKNSA